ncbi:hypothetical protein BC943DRAFT_334305 [Umbelopsis sp. AD052]|nr:hypothetical protein BC943DRAFT_334305 [Umbelopsis sp. AD052]
MEAIDGLANENIVRSVAFAALQFRQQRNYDGLLSISTQLLQQRFRFLGSQADSTDEDKDYVVQWQKDESPKAIDIIWSGHEEDLFQSKIYYKRSDAETIYAMVEFASQDDKHFVVVVAKEDDAEEQEWKYHNTKIIDNTEWTDVIQKEWDTRIEDAERRFLQNLTKHNEDQKKKRKEKHHKKNGKGAVKRSPSGEDQQGRLAPDDYWGDWSSENPSQEVSGESEVSSDADSEDSEDVYYNNWSNHPVENESHSDDDMGTEHVAQGQSREMRSPSLFKQLDFNHNAGSPSLMEQEEIQEEYDNSHNPLFTVPSVPNLMDMHTSALHELTSILNTTIQPGEGKSRAINMNPLPKVMYQRQMTDDADYDCESVSRPESIKHVSRLPGGWPESRQEEDDSSSYHSTQINQHQSTVDQSELSSSSAKFPWFSQNGSNAAANGSDTRETAKSFLMKSLSALIGVARMLGFTGQQISDMVDQIVKQQPDSEIPSQPAVVAVPVDANKQ